MQTCVSMDNFDPFSDTPFPALVLIAKSVPDLASLHSLRSASPTCAALFTLDDCLGAEIVEVVVSTNMANCSQKIIHIIWELLRHPTTTWSATRELGRFWLSPYANHELRQIQPASPNRESTLRLLSLAKVVHCAAHRCLHTLLQRCLALRPRRPVDSKLNLRRMKFWKESRHNPFEPPPEPLSEPVGRDVAAAAGPLEWVEEQRALKGAWKLALINVVRDIAAAQWPSEDYQQLSGISVVETWRAFNDQGAFAGRCLLPTILDVGTASSLISAPAPTLADVFESAPSCSQANCSVNKSCSDPAWEPGPSGLGASCSVHRIYIYGNSLPYSPLRTFSFEPFISLGVYIWEKHRLVSMGLLYSHADVRTRFGGRHHLAEHSELYVWRSLLTAERLKALEESQRAEWPIPG